MESDIIKELMIKLENADKETVNKIAWEYGSLPVRLAMLGLASVRKGQSPLWWGYPPGVFISYKWGGDEITDFVRSLSSHLKSNGYETFLDVEKVAPDADAYFQIPEFVSSLQYCQFCILILTEASADMLFARNNKTTWIFDEYQHAVRLTNLGQLFIVPILLEEKGLGRNFTMDTVIDFTDQKIDFNKLNDLFVPDPFKLPSVDVDTLSSICNSFDRTFLSSNWQGASQILNQNQKFKDSFDFQLRQMLLALYTANEKDFLHYYHKMTSIYGDEILLHIYNGYCKQHEIPPRLKLD